LAKRPAHLLIFYFLHSGLRIFDVLIFAKVACDLYIFNLWQSGLLYILNLWQSGLRIFIFLIFGKAACAPLHF